MRSGPRRLEHTEDKRATRREIARVSRPGGAFRFAVPAFPELWRHHDVMYGHFRGYRKVDFVARVQAAGLTVEGCRFFRCAGFPPFLLLAKLERVMASGAERRDEEPSGLTRWMPFGLPLLCVGQR